MQVSASSIRTSNWYIMLIRVTSTSNSALELRGMDFDTVLASVQSSNFFPGGFNWPGIAMQTITIGIDSDFNNEGFIGSIRNLRILSSNPSDSTTKLIQYTYLNSNSALQPAL